MIELKSLGKKYFKEWIFRHMDLTCEEGTITSIVGPNGGGKSTFLKVLMGFIPETEGGIQYVLNGKNVPTEEIYKFLSLATPYQELLEDLTLLEFLNFHFQFKKLHTFDSVQDLVAHAYLNGHENKQIKNFSSGMKQRVRLASAMFSEVPLLFLDEPTTNLDDTAIDWYQKSMKMVQNKTHTFIASNIKAEIALCDSEINISNYK